MSTIEDKSGARSNALVTAWISLAAPVAMVFLAALLPKDNPPLHRVDNSWYFQLTAFICFFAILAAGWALTHKPKSAAAISAIAILGIAASIAIGLAAMFLTSVHGMHT